MYLLASFVYKLKLKLKIFQIKPNFCFVFIDVLNNAYASSKLYIFQYKISGKQNIH